MVQHMFEKWQLGGNKKVQMEGFFLFKDSVSLFCHGPGTSLLFRPGHCFSHPLSLSLSCLNPAQLLYVGRWSFDLISSEILPFLLITNCFTHSNTKSLPNPPSTPHCLPTPQSFNQSPPFVAVSHSLSSFPWFSSLFSSNFQSPQCSSDICMCTADRNTERMKEKRMKEKRVRRQTNI